MNPAPRILALFGNVPLLGQERANIETLDALRETGCAVRFLIRAEHTATTIQAELIRRRLDFVTVPYYQAVRHGQTALTWARNAAGILGGSWQLMRQIRDFRATAIHVGSTPNVLNFLPALLVTRVPLVFRAGDLPPTHHAVWRLVWRFALSRSAFFVCDSEFVRSRLIALGVLERSTAVIYSPAPRRAGIESRRTRLHGPGSGLTVLYVGQISRDKGVHLLVEAAMDECRARANIRFLIAGDYEWRNDFAMELIERVRQAGLSERIHFTGFVENIDALYEQAQVHVCPSLLEEAYGLTVVEAKERGVPSVVFASGGLPELVGNGIDGLVCGTKTAQALREAIDVYAEQPALAQAHGSAALASLDRLGVRQFAQKWRTVYENVHSERRRTREARL